MSRVFPAHLHDRLSTLDQILNQRENRQDQGHPGERPNRHGTRVAEHFQMLFQLIVRHDDNAAIHDGSNSFTGGKIRVNLPQSIAEQVIPCSHNSRADKIALQDGREQNAGSIANGRRVKSQIHIAPTFQGYPLTRRGIY